VLEIFARLLVFLENNLYQKGTGKIWDCRGKISIKPAGFIGRPKHCLPLREFGQILLACETVRQNLGYMVSRPT